MSNIETTSGSTTFTLTRNQIISTALMLIGVVGAEDTASSSDQTLANNLLNMMVKAWEGDGCSLWELQEATLYIANGTASYQLGNGARATNTSVETTSSATENAAATTITLTTVTGMAVNDNIGIVQDSGTTFWTTINAINTGTSVVTLNAGLTSIASSGTAVYTFTTAIPRPWDVTQVRFRNSGNIDRVLERKSREDFFAIPNKSSIAQPVSYYYDVQLNYGTLYFWPIPDSDLERISFTYIRTIQDLINSADNPDMPQEFLLALTYGLAVLLAPAYGKDSKMMEGLGQVAEKYYKMAKNYNIDVGPLRMYPDLRMSR